MNIMIALNDKSRNSLLDVGEAALHCTFVVIHTDY
jgi:hypothetical protein